MAYNINDINEIAHKLHLQNLVDTSNCAIEGLRTVNEQINVLVITIHNTVGKAFLKDCIGLSFGPTNRLNPCMVDISSGNNNEYIVDTEFGKISVDENTFIKQLSLKSSQTLHARITKQSTFGKSLNVHFVFINDFSELSLNEWILKLASTDKIYYLLDGLQIFSDKEKSFADSILFPIFFSKRCTFVVGNSKFLNENEQKEILEYSKSVAGEDISILLDDEYILRNDIESVADCALELRKELEPGVTNYLTTRLLAEITPLKKDLLSQNTELEEAISLLSENSQVIEDSKKRIQNKIDSFIKDYAFIQFEKRVDGFNRALRDSLTNDIRNSEDIDVDSKWINKYMEFVWSKFISEQESWLKSTILTEVTDIETLINSDLNLIIGQMDTKSQKLLKDYVMAKYNVHSFLIGKEGKTDVGELSKVMKIGSLVMALFAPFAAILTFGGSELVKLVFKDKIEQGKKTHLVVAVEKMSKQMSEQILMQASKQFASIAEKLKEQTMSVYGNLLSELTDVLSSKRKNAKETDEMLSIINNIELTYK